MRITVEIDLGAYHGEEFLQACKDAAPEGWVSIDRTFLRVDPTDDSFYLFRLVNPQ